MKNKNIEYPPGNSKPARRLRRKAVTDLGGYTIRSRKDLSKFIRSCDELNLSVMKCLCTRAYEKKSSVLHKSGSPIVKKIDWILAAHDVSVPAALYIFVHRIECLPLCHCGEKVEFLSLRNGFREFCSSKCMFVYNEVQDRRKQTNLVRLGVTVPAKSSRVKRKMRKTCLERYGVEYSLQSEMVREKGRKTLLDETGYSISTQNPATKAKSIQTCLERYGTEHPMQDPSVAARVRKAMYERKSILVQGSFIEGLQGYEPQAIEHLVNDKGYSIHDVVVHPRKVFFWKDISGKPHAYHPDLKIRGKKHFIEVKSEYTLKIADGARQANKLKRAAVIAEGYKFSFLVIKPGSEPVWITKNA